MKNSLSHGYYLEINVANSDISTKPVRQNCWSMFTPLFIFQVEACYSTWQNMKPMHRYISFETFFSLQLKWWAPTGLWLKGLNWFSGWQLIVLMFYLYAWSASLWMGNSIFIDISSPCWTWLKVKLDGQCSSKWMNIWQFPMGSYILVSKVF